MIALQYCPPLHNRHRDAPAETPPEISAIAHLAEILFDTAPEDAADAYRPWAATEAMVDITLIVEKLMGTPHIIWTHFSAN